MYKQIDRGISSLLALKRGVDELADTVKVTLGPKGRPVILETAYGASILTKDGVTVAQNILLKDPVENQGAKLVRDVTSKTNDVSGDGTTTSAVLTQAIISEGVKSISGGVNGQTIKTGIDKAAKAIVEALVKSSVFKLSEFGFAEE
jgi:chaperonin GroEL